MTEKKIDKEFSFTRRAFIGGAAMAGAALAACGGNEEPASPSSESRAPATLIQPGPLTAPDGPVLRAGLVGCGGRGTGAAINFLSSGPNLEIVALADVFEDRLNDCRTSIKEKAGAEIPDENCYLGFDAYQKLIDSDLDIVMLATPPHFRPEHFAAAVDARKHVFMEKPVAVDPTGIRSIIESAERADAFDLCVVTGTQRRHQRSYIETYNRIAEGMIGEIVAARCYWNQSQLWYKNREANWSDMEYMIRDWVNWCWLSGDHIVEQHVHNIDVVNWFTNSHPVRAVGMGGRHRRVTGDQYDFFTVDLEMENGIHAMSMCRQIDGCANNVSEFVVGTKGSSNCKDTIFAPDGSVLWEFQEREAGSEQGEGVEVQSPYVQEHTDLVTAIRTDNRINEAVNTANSNLVAIMGRLSAYAGLETTWDEMMQSDLRLGPEEYQLGPVSMETIVPVPGTAPEPV